MSGLPKFSVAALIVAAMTATAAPAQAAGSIRSLNCTVNERLQFACEAVVFNLPDDHTRWTVDRSLVSEFNDLYSVTGDCPETVLPPKQPSHTVTITLVRGSVQEAVTTNLACPVNGS